MADEKMVKIAVGELTGVALDWAVAKAEGFDSETLDPITWVCTAKPSKCYDFSTNWSQGGPIVDKTGICLSSDHEDSGEGWVAYLPGKGNNRWGATALQAAMSCYASAKLADKEGFVSVPEQLVEPSIEDESIYPTPGRG